MADIYVNFPSMPAGYIRGTIDFDLEELLEGWRTVSGGGAGLRDSGFHVDLELDTNDQTKIDEFIVVLKRYLHSLPAPDGTELVLVVDGPEGGVHLPVY
jgi:hypothetical protein